jgi:hypothetical protein
MNSPTKLFNAISRASVTPHFRRLIPQPSSTNMQQLRPPHSKSKPSLLPRHDAALDRSHSNSLDSTSLSRNTSSERVTGRLPGNAPG